MEKFIGLLKNEMKLDQVKGTLFNDKYYYWKHLKFIIHEKELLPFVFIVSISGTRILTFLAKDLNQG